MTQTPRQRSARRRRLAVRAQATALYEMTSARQALDKLPDAAFQAGRAEVAGDLFIRIEGGIREAQSDRDLIAVLFEAREHLSGILGIISPAEEEAELLGEKP